MKPMKLFCILLAIALATVLQAAVPDEWRCDVAASNPRQIQAYRGETLLLSCTFLRGGKPIAAPMQTATFYWQTNGMAFWQQTNAVVAGATVSAEFTPAMDWGAPQYRFFLGVQDAAGINYRANGVISFADSPGAAPGSPPPLPGAIWNFADVTVIGAPWATLEEIDAELEGYASTQDVAAVAAAIPSLDAYATTSNVSAQIAASAAAERATTDADIAAAASNAIAAAVAQIPSLSGYATEAYVQAAIGDIETPDLAGYATRAYADAAASNAQANAVAQIPSLSGYATEAYVQAAIGDIETPDLAGYATRAYADAAASNAQAAAVAQIPSLAGYATESYVQDAIGDIEMPDLAGYATRAYADAAASNAQASAVAQIPSLSGYATESYVQDAIGDIEMPDLAGYATRAYVDAAASNVAAAADAKYLTEVPGYYATQGWVRDQIETGGGGYSAGVWSNGYVLDATGVVSTATIITNAIPTPPYTTNTTIIIDGGVTTTVETVTTNYTYEVVTNLAPAYRAFMAPVSVGPENAVASIAAQSVLSVPVLYLADDGRIYNRIRDSVYLCQDGSYLDYGYPYYDAEIWRYIPADGNYVFCYDGEGRPATNPAPPSVIKWIDSGAPEVSATLKSVLSAFPLYAPAAALAAATNAILADAKAYTAAAVTNVVRDIQGLVYDDALGVSWQAKMHDGALYYIAVTNSQEVAE